MSDSEGDLTGNGSITNPSGSIAISGMRTNSDVSISLLVSSGSVFNFIDITAVHRGDLLIGTASGAGFDDTPVELKRISLVHGK
jgi:hypothetical protein